MMTIINLLLKKQEFLMQLINHGVISIHVSIEFSERSIHGIEVWHCDVYHNTVQYK